ncbi:unnamed protein product, partial [marine sediment metagenome]
SSHSGSITLKTGTAHYSGFGSATTGSMLLETGDIVGVLGVAGDITIAPGRGNTTTNSGAIIFDIFTEVARFTNAGDLHFKDNKEIILGDDSDLILRQQSAADIIYAILSKPIQFGTPSSDFMQIDPIGDVTTTQSMIAEHTVQGEQITSTDDITMQGYLLTLGNDG